MSSSNPSPSSSPKEVQIFKNDQHATNITRKLLKFYEEESFLDTVILAGQDYIKIQAHEIVLSAFSEYCLEIFRNIPKTSKIYEVEIKEVEGSALKSIVDYMYSGSIELNMEKIEILLRAAVFLKIQTLIDGCCDFLEKNLNNDNCLHWLRLTKELNLSGPQLKSLNFIYSHLEKVSKETEFLLLDEIELKDLLFNNNMYTDLEEQVFLSMGAWIKFDQANRQHLLLGLLSMVRYHFLTAKFIIENVESVCFTFEHSQMILRWLRFHLSPTPTLRTVEEQKSAFDSNRIIKANLNQDGDTFSVIHLNKSFEAEIRSYNQTLKTWSLDKRLPPFSARQGRYTLIVIDEKLLKAGGKINNTITNSFECLDLKTAKKIYVPPMQVPRYDSQLANINGHLCVFGGFTEQEFKNFIDSVEIFNFSTQKWTNLQPLIKPNMRQKITGHNGILYIFDFHYGCFQCYDVSTNKWTSKKLPIDDSVGDFRIAGLDNFLYFVIGGEFKPENEWTSYKNLTLKRYDLLEDTWCEVDVLQNKEFIGKIVTIIGNQILFVNGNSFIAEYNLETKKFTKIPAAACYYYHAYICPFKW